MVKANRFQICIADKLMSFDKGIKGLLNCVDRFPWDTLSILQAGLVIIDRQD